MRSLCVAVILALAVAGQLAAQQPGAAQPAQGNPAAAAADLRLKASYIIGSNIGQQMKADGLDLDLASMMRGIQDGQSGAKSPFSDQEIQQVMQQYQQQMAAQQKQNALASGRAAVAAAVKAGDKNASEGVAFLTRNMTAEGVKTLPSGLQYKIIKSGAGPTPKASDNVTTHYRGTLVNGAEFDSSYARGEPVTFPVGGVIAGWTEALQQMKVGDKWQLFIPSELAYGEQGRPPKINPHSVLIFDIELLGIEAGRQQP